MSGRHVPVAAPVLRVCGLLIVTAGVLLTAAPAGAAAALKATPSTGLTDGQVVTVQVTGFDSDFDVALTVVQCNPNPRSIEDCDEAHTWDALALEPDGTGSAPFRVHVLPSEGGGNVRCGAGYPCTLAVLSDPDDFTARMAVTPISFAGGPAVSTTSSSVASGYAASNASPSSGAPVGSATSSSASAGSARSSSAPPASIPPTSAPPAASGSPAVASSPTTHNTVAGARGTVPVAASSERGAGTDSAFAAPSGTSQPASLTLPAPLASTGADAHVLLLGLGSALGMGGLLVQRRALRDGEP
jgi:hypothetical protein